MVHRLLGCTAAAGPPESGPTEERDMAVENRPAELWRLLHLTEPKKWPRFADYAERFLKPVRGREVGRAVRSTAGRVERLVAANRALGRAICRTTFFD